MKVKRKILLSIIGISTICIIANPTKSKAALQANPTTHANPVNKNGATWQTQIRQMETTGQTMGLDEILDGLEATEDNGIDVHMMLPTEYGAVAILSASGYGNPGKLIDEADVQKRTTTGNATGVYFTGDRWELVAGYSNAIDGKYVKGKNTSDTALDLTISWHEGGRSTIRNAWYLNQYQNKTGEPTVVLMGGLGMFGRGDLTTFYESSSTYINAWTGKQQTSSYVTAKNIWWGSRGCAVSRNIII